MILFLLERVCQSPRGLLTGGIILLFGVILDRFNVSWLGVQHLNPRFYMATFMSNFHYMPNVPEISVSLGIFAAGILAFVMAGKILAGVQ